MVGSADASGMRALAAFGALFILVLASTPDALGLPQRPAWRQQASAKPPPEPEAQPAAASSRRSRPGWAPFGSEAAPGQTPQQAESPATDDRDR